METKEQMLARHARELAELDSRWWEEWFTEDPIASFTNHWHGNHGLNIEQWVKRVLPTIIRKREKIGVTITWRGIGHSTALAIWSECHSNDIALSLAEKLAGRTLAPGEKVAI